MNRNELNALLRKKNYRVASDSRSYSKLECAVGDASLVKDETKEGDSGKYTVRVTSFRRRLLDADNLAEKYHIDALRYAGILPSDAPDRCEIITSQVRVKSKEEELTEISIEK